MLASVMVPGTPPLNGPMNTYRPPSTQPSPSLSDDSAMELPDFPYFTNSQGEFVRMKTPSPDHSPSPSGGSRRASLSRSESAPCVIDQSPAPGSVPAARQFARVSSGPIPTVPTISTPAMASTYFPRSTGLSSTARKFTSAPRRVVRQEDRDAAERDQGKENGDAMPLASSSTSTRPLAEVMPVPQRTVGANGRPVMPVPSRSVRRKPEPITEVDDVDEIGHHQPRHSLSTSTGIRPRRSASLSDAAPEDFPATYMRSANIGARRVTLEEKLKREREITLEEGLRGSSEAQIQESRKTPSPTHVATQPAALRGLAHYHQRKESDTIQTMATSSSPTVVERRVSPGMVGSDSNSSGEHGREHRYAYVNGDHLSAAGMYRDKHSPTTVERPVYPDPMSSYAHQSGKPWATDSGRDSAGEEARPDNQYHKQAAKAAMSQQRITQASRRAPSVPPQTQQQVVNGKSFVVNKKAYTRLEMVGKGGTSRVYKVISPSHEVLAVKKVQLDDSDSETMHGYMNEIALLKRLEGNTRIIRLLDSEIKQGSGGSKGMLFLVMELGEVDLAKLLHEQQKRPIDFVWVAYYFKQILQAVHVIHEEKIVHSDLKPANFVVVKGQLKLIDFGIANAIANDTTNIHRDHQVGTVNYMSPETIEYPEDLRRLKVGRPSDVWSVGCILYQMIYGHPPFHYCNSIVQKMKAIPDPNVEIQFPAYIQQVVSPVDAKLSSQDDAGADGRVRVPVSIINTIKRCLVRNPKERATIPELLAETWLTMSEPVAPRSPSPPSSRSLRSMLNEHEAVININLVKQMLEYAITLPRKDLIDDDLASHMIDQLRDVYFSQS